MQSHDDFDDDYNDHDADYETYELSLIWGLEWNAHQTGEDDLTGMPVICFSRRQHFGFTQACQVLPTSLSA